MTRNTDIERAKRGLEGKTLCLCRGEAVITSDKRGIAPLMELIAGGVNLKGFSAADKVVGKAAAMLFAYCGITEVYAAVISERALEALSRLGVKCEYGGIVPYIINRKGDGMCPMEQAVQDIDEPTEALETLKRRLAQ